MIDSLSETLLTLAQAADELPRRRRGRKAHVSTLYRWATAGCRGIVLETIQVGGTRCTSPEALQRFFVALSSPGNARAAGADACTSTRTSARRMRDSEAAARALEKAGG